MESLPATIQENTPPIAAMHHSVPTSHEMLAYQTYAKTAVESQMYRGIGRESGVMMIMLAAREYGIGPAQALNGGLNIIEGKVELSARVMTAMIRRAKHTLKIIEDSDEKCTVYGCRSDTGEEHTVTYTIEQAQRAGLIKEKGGWKKVPDDMLFARAMSKLARRLFSDVIGIGYVQGEINVERAREPEPTSIDVPPSDNEDLDSFLLQLDEDCSLAAKYVKTVANAYKWTIPKAIAEMKKNMPAAIKMFQEWKAKR